MSGHRASRHSKPTVVVSPVSSAEPGVRRGGAHRLPAPPAALTGRVALVAVAAGAVVATAAATDSPSTAPTTIAMPAVDPAALDVTQAAPTSASTSAQPAVIPNAPSSTAPGVLSLATPMDTQSATTLVDKGNTFAAARAAREAAARRPLFVLPAQGEWTSTYGTRWGTIHGGVDIANNIGTPILAVADGTVIDAGPASGFGLWVRIKHDDGTITVYGHVDTILTQVGARVMAGDQIATMGNRGQSTGPHLHFEVWLNGSDRSDPAPWLAQRGISLGSYFG